VVVRVSQRTYDEQALLDRLTRLDRNSKTAFAAACAQRLLPLFERYARSTGEPELGARLGVVVSAAWGAASGLDTEIRSLQSEAEAIVPSDEDGWSVEMGYGQHAAASAAYAIRTWLTDDPQEAAWGARQVYEVADFAFLQGSPDLDLNAPGVESQVLASEFVQEALEAIAQSLDAVEAAPTDWGELQAAAAAQGRVWADVMP
jgi:hypothetical protein